MNKHIVFALLGGAVVGFYLGGSLWNLPPWGNIADAVVGKSHVTIDSNTGSKVGGAYA